VLTRRFYAAKERGKAQVVASNAAS